MSAEHVPGLPEKVDIYDTTLRDGSQQEGLSLSVDDKLRVARQLDSLGVAYIEGGWPGANPKDEEFFRRAQSELQLTTAKLVAFGSTRRATTRADQDPTLRSLVEANTSAACIVGKAWDYHVEKALRTTLDEGVRMVADSVAFLRNQGIDVFLDAEHFFDGYKSNREFTLEILKAAQDSGAKTLVLCDTNGGTLPHEVEEILEAISPRFTTEIGVHFHNDSGCAIANALAAVRMGVTHVQGCVNGYGERTGNADLSVTIPNLSLKMGVETVPRDRIELISSVSRHVAEIVNINLDPQKPYVGTSAFAHKAGLHVSAITRRKDAYEHVSPEFVGNGSRFIVSEMSGKSTLAIKAAELGLDLNSEELSDVLEHLKDLEHKGYHFEAADGSLELLMRKASGWSQDYFTLESFRVITDHREDVGAVTEATVKVVVDGSRMIATAEGNGPVNALDSALRKALAPYFEKLSKVHLTDFRVRVIDSALGSGAVVRVLLDSSDGNETWSTMGVSENIIDASWQALIDSIVMGLIKVAETPSI
ncbi:MAG: citramalate synthase [Actinomycetota bacterium]|nr:citramalate synthase [Actinomycetota bacterium]